MTHALAKCKSMVHNSSKGGHHGTEPICPILPSSGRFRPILPFWRAIWDDFVPYRPSRRSIWDEFAGGGEAFLVSRRSIWDEIVPYCPPEGQYGMLSAEGGKLFRMIVF